MRPRRLKQEKGKGCRPEARRYKCCGARLPEELLDRMLAQLGKLRSQKRRQDARATIQVLRGALASRQTG